MTGTRCMFRYVVPDDGAVHLHRLSHNPVAVAACSEPYDAVEFWAEHTEGGPQLLRAFRVYGTGNVLPADAAWVGTCPRTSRGIVFHLYELPVKAPPFPGGPA